VKKELKKITDITINNLLNNDVIMPSIYFEKFNKNAKTLNIDIEDSSFQKELNEILIEDFNSIEIYMYSIQKNASIMENVIKASKKALIHKDIESLSNIYLQITKLENEVKDLNNKLFIDDLTSCNNRKWIYNKFLNKKAQFKNFGISVLIDISNFDYIYTKYGELLSNNLIIFITNFIRKKLKEEKINFEIARLFNSQFLIFIDEKDEKEISNYIFNIKQLLKDTILESKTGLVIRADYNYTISKYIKNQDSKEIFEILFQEIK